MHCYASTEVNTVNAEFANSLKVFSVDAWPRTFPWIEKRQVVTLVTTLVFIFSVTSLAK